MFGAAFRDEMVKLALKYTSKDYKGNSFTYASQEEIHRGLLRQPAGRVRVGMASSSARPAVVRQLIEQTKHPSGVAGTIAPNAHQGRNIMMMHRGLRDYPKALRRMVIAHEAFHGRTPVLGRSEILAHAYGGWKSNKGLKRLWNTDMTVGGHGTGALNQIGMLAKLRPSRFAQEALLVGTAGALGLGAYHGIKAIREARQAKKDEEKAG